MIRAKLFASEGSLDQRKGGEMSFPSHVNRLGISAPSAKPSIISLNDIRINVLHVLCQHS